jgi:hypothetical protein
MTAYDKHNEPDFNTTIDRWQAHYEELSGRLNDLDQASENVFLKMGRGVEDLSRRCREILEMTRLATTTLSKHETLQAAEHIGHEMFSYEGHGIIHGILKDADTGKNPETLPDILPNILKDQPEDHFQELWHLIRKLDVKASPMAERAISISNTLSETINNIVVAIQFQDITRQEMEKVRDSLENLAQRTNLGSNGKEGTAGEAAGETSELLIDVMQTCDHQARRMEVVGGKINDAFSAIHKNLTGSGDEVMDVCIIMASLAEIVQSIPFEIKKLVKQHKSAAPANGQEPDADRREFAILSKAVLSGTVRVVSLSRIIEEKARSLSEEIKEMERVLTDDHQISHTLESMIGDLREMSDSSRAAASRLMPEGHEVPVLNTGGDDTDLISEDAQAEDGHGEGPGSVEFF